MSQGPEGSDKAQAWIRLRIQDDRGGTRLTPELIRRLTDALASAQRARLVSIEGVPGSFCEGLDIEAVLSERGDRSPDFPPDAGLAGFAKLLRTLDRTHCAVVALVDGPALGGGVGLAAVADLVLATSRATFALPETLMGLIPAMVFPFVARRLGVAKARLLALGGKPLSVTEALHLGLVDEIVDDLEAGVRRYARRFSYTDPRAVAAMKALVATHFTPQSGYELEAGKYFTDLLGSDETLARIRRFVEGESPWPEGSVL